MMTIDQKIEGSQDLQGDSQAQETPLETVNLPGSNPGLRDLLVEYGRPLKDVTDDPRHQHLLACLERMKDHPLAGRYVIVDISRSILLKELTVLGLHS